MKIAVMQPYFYPYAGYFRLFGAVDTFVVFDCVQFPRRGWVHRNTLVDRNGKKSWLTLPLSKGARDATRIMDLQFRPDAREDLERQLSSFACIPELRRSKPDLYEKLVDVSKDPVSYLVEHIRVVNDALGFSPEIVRSSSLRLPDELRGENRILEIASRLSASTYINLAGGRELYNHENFARQGIELKFLSDYDGPYDSMLSRIALEEHADLRREISSKTVFC